MNSDDINEITAELRELEKVAQSRLAKRASRRNRRYVFNVLFDQAAAAGSVYATPPISKTAKVTIDRPFYCADLEACVRFVGSVGAGSSTQANLPLVQTTLNSLGSSAYTLGLFDFFWALRDSSSDREWTKGKQPSAVLESNVFGPLQLPRRQYCPAGTEVTLDVEPLFVALGTFGDVTVTGIQLEFCLVGYET